MSDAEIASRYFNELKADSARELSDKTTSFTTRLFAVNHLRTVGEKHPELIGPEIISTLRDLLKNAEYGERRQSLFLFRETADALCALIRAARNARKADPAMRALENVLRTTSGFAHRAAAEVLGDLPMSVRGPRVKKNGGIDPPRVHWRSLPEKTGLEFVDNPVFAGRSLLVETGDKENLLVLKLAREDDSPEMLETEAFWMAHLRSRRDAFPVRFNIPEALEIDRSHVFSLRGIPMEPPGNIRLHPKRWAMGFVAPREYFTYPNEWDGEKRPSIEEFTEIISRNAWLLGRLSSLGIVHSAPIPLFHNRVQQTRRRDHGLYEWFRAGRLDRWLESCSFPNMGPTGIRDFEHMTSVDGGGAKFYRLIGNHFLSLLLVTGSYFRNKNRDRVGLDKNGDPVDARDLFDGEALGEIIRGIFSGYYEGFTRSKPPGPPPLDLDELKDRMIEEMGVDRHMEEFLRVVDQDQMSRKRFESFLRERNFTDHEIRGMEKGEADITIRSGPHLGEFNHTISLPELIHSVESMSAACIAGKFWKEKFNA
ncbi:MAG: SidJ-related pseudokinase [Desulfobacterales bacterium]|nr:SidJ-related pseudokinase [Desulfobacterales bacterium]